MWAFKTAGVTLIVISCSLAGFLKSRSVIARGKKLSLLCDGILLLFEYIDQGNYELGDALKTAFSRCDFLSFEKSDYICCDSDLSVDDKLIISDFFRSLGCSAKKADCDRIKSFSTLMQKRQKEAQDEAKQKSKVYQTLGVCIGLSIGILLI